MKKEVIPEDYHHVYGGSVASRFLNCAGYVKAVEADKKSGLIPMENTSSAAAHEGTVAHALGETILNKGYEVEDFYMQDFMGFQMHEGFTNAVKVYVDYVREMVGEDGELFVEESFDLRDYANADCGGSADAVVIRDGVMYVIDYKHGKGVVVEVDGNSQTRLYALGALRLFKKLGHIIKKVVMVIVQPRVHHRDGMIRSETVKASAISAWGRKVLKPGIVLSEKGPLDFNPGNWCTFCPRVGYCTGKNDQMKEILKSDFVEDEPMYLPAVTKMTNEEVEFVLEHGKAITDWVTAVKAHALRVAELGATFKQFKMVGRQGNRKFIKKDKAVLRKLHKLGIDKSEAFLEAKMKSPAQLEKTVASHLGAKVAKEFISGIASRPATGNALAPLTDGRAVAPTSAQSDFDEVSN